MLDKYDSNLEYYNNHAVEYSILNDKNTQMSIYHQWFKEFVKNGKIYDFGCGTGRDVSALQSLGFDVIGFDYSEGMLKVAEKNYPTCKFQSFDLLKDDFSSLDKADGIWACASLLHLNVIDFGLTLIHFSQLLKHDSYLFLSMKLADSTHFKQVNDRVFTYYKKEDLFYIIKNTFFEVIKVDESINNGSHFISLLLKNTLNSHEL